MQYFCFVYIVEVLDLSSKNQDKPLATAAERKADPPYLNGSVLSAICVKVLNRRKLFKIYSG